MRIIEIDATNKILGRLATRIAEELRGKNLTTFRPDRLPDVTVKVSNVSKLKVSGQKLAQKKYHRYSGYPGGLKTETLAIAMAKHPDRVLMLAVKRMLPDNRLRAVMLKRLIIS